MKIFPIIIVVLLAGQTVHAVSRGNFDKASWLHEGFLASQRLDSGRDVDGDRAKRRSYLDYLSGVVDAYADLCPNKDVTDEQVGAIVGQYVEATPQS